MIKRFAGKTAVITGAGSGIGFEIARQLALEGASVVLNDIHMKMGEEAANNIRQDSKGVCVPFPGDASDPGFLDELVRYTIDQFGGLNLAIANAGMTLFKNFFDVKPSDLNAVIDLNFRGTFFFTQAAARQMVAQGEGGKVLLLSSVTGIQAYPDLVVYARPEHEADGVGPGGYCRGGVGDVGDTTHLPAHPVHGINSVISPRSSRSSMSARVIRPVCGRGAGTVASPASTRARSTEPGSAAVTSAVPTRIASRLPEAVLCGWPI